MAQNDCPLLKVTVPFPESGTVLTKLTVPFSRTHARKVDYRRVGLLTEDLSENLNRIERSITTVALLVRAAIPTRRSPAGRFRPGAPSPPE